jgi:hypothetical protein
LWFITAKIGKNLFLQNRIFAVNYAQTFLQCLPLLTHEVLGSNPAFERNWIFAIFLGVYRETRFFGHTLMPAAKHAHRGEAIFNLAPRGAKFDPRG